MSSSLGGSGEPLHKPPEEAQRETAAAELDHVRASLLAAARGIVDSALDLDCLGDSLAELVARVIESDHVFVYARPDSESDLGLIAHRGEPADRPDPALERLASRVALRAPTEPGVLTLDPAALGGELAGAHGVPAGGPILACAVRDASRQIMGALVVFAVRPAGAERDEARVLQGVADVAAAAVGLSRRWNARLTHQARLERQIEVRTAEVGEARTALLRQEQVAAMGKLAATIAHEVNNPMSFILANLNEAVKVAHGLDELLPRLARLTRLALDLPESDDARIARVRREAESLGGGPFEGSDGLCELVTDTLEGAERIRRISEDMRRFAQGLPGTFELADVNTVLETALHVVDAERRDGVRFVRHLGPLPEVRCQRHQIAQVLLNLLQNAIEAVAGAGSIEVRTRAAESWIEVEVADDGPGVEARVRDRIFEAFYTSKEQGSGLGLSISRDIVVAHGGTLEVIGSAVGACFRLRIPIQGA